VDASVLEEGIVLTIPQFVARTGARGSSAKLKVLKSTVLAKELPLVQQKLFRIQGRAACAFALGAAEWVAWRLDGLGAPPEMFNVIESQWTAIVDPLYAVEWRRAKKESPDDLVLVPANAALRNAREAIDNWALKNIGGKVQYAMYLANIARFVQPDPKPFDAWVNTIFDRFAALFPASDADPWGPAIPREAVDPDFDFKPEYSPALIQAFLAKLDPTANPYLRAGDAMLKEGFTGEPYKI
jgi:hypothetical protein